MRLNQYEIPNLFTWFPNYDEYDVIAHFSINLWHVFKYTLYHERITYFRLLPCTAGRTPSYFFNTICLTTYPFQKSTYTTLIKTADTYIHAQTAWKNKAITPLLFVVKPLKYSIRRKNNVCTRHKAAVRIHVFRINMASNTVLIYVLIPWLLNFYDNGV